MADIKMDTTDQSNGLQETRSDQISKPILQEQEQHQQDDDEQQQQELLQSNDNLKDIEPHNNSSSCQNSYIEQQQIKQQYLQTQQQKQPTQQDTVKIYAPVITHDVNISSETFDRETMAVIPIPDSQTTLGLPMSAINGILGNQLKKSLKAEMEARELLNWKDGIGVLEGCDLRFRINKHGCLELLDSDDEELENFNIKYNNCSINSSHNNNNQINNTKTQSKLKTTSSTPTHLTNGITTPKLYQNQNSSLPVNNTTAETNDTNSISNNNNPTSLIKQISPGSSLLRGGPNNNNLRRPTKINQTAIMRKLENYQNGILLEKLIPRQRIENLKQSVESWNPQEVRQFVDSIPGCFGAGELFEMQEICGKSLLYLDQKDLLEVINVKLGPAVKIYHAISLLK